MKRHVKSFRRRPESRSGSRPSPGRRFGSKRPTLISVISIDGPAGCGKSTVSRTLAGRLGFHHVDTGAMYRAVAFLLADRLDQLHRRPRKVCPRSGKERPGWLLDSSRRGRAEVERLIKRSRIRLSPGRKGSPTVVWLNGRNISRQLRTERVSRAASIVATVPWIRRHLVELQRRMASPPGLVMEGRDIGTVVFPDAPVKIFLTATAAERARRRAKDLRAAGEKVSLLALEREIRARDRRDRTRKHSPLVPARDAIRVDTSRFSEADVVDRIENIIRRKLCCARSQFALLEGHALSWPAERVVAEQDPARGGVPPKPKKLSL